MSEHLRTQWRKTASGIRGHLEMIADMQKASREKQHPDWKFHSVEELILHYGREYTPGLLAEDLCQGEMGACYQNAMDAAMGRSDLTYVEGYADSGYFPTGHAWVTADGRTAMDPTWDKANGYFGVPLRSSFWQSWIARTGYWGVFFVDIPDENFLSLLREGLPAGAVA